MLQIESRNITVSIMSGVFNRFSNYLYNFFFDKSRSLRKNTFKNEQQENLNFSEQKFQS